MFAVLGLGAVFHKLEKLLHALANGRIELKFHANPEAGIAFDHDAVEDETFYPDFAAGQPQSNLNVHSTFNGRDGFDVAATHAGVREIAPNWRF